MRSATADVRPPGHAARHEPVAAQAFELSLDPPSTGLVIGISHEGGTPRRTPRWRPRRAAGARTAIITVTGRSPGAALADLVVETGELDQSWCHTVGYLSPLVAATAAGAHLTGRAVDARSGDAVRSLVAAGVDRANVTEATGESPGRASDRSW